MCIQINTQFINLLVIKKNVNLYIERKQSHVMMKEWLVLFPIFQKWVLNPQRNNGNSLNYSSLTTITTPHADTYTRCLLAAFCSFAFSCNQTQTTEGLRGFKVICSCRVITASSYRKQELNLEASPQQMTLMCKFKTEEATERRQLNTPLSP